MDRRGKTVNSVGNLFPTDLTLMAARKPHPAFEILAPQTWRFPALFNSPHSGRDYRAAFVAQTRLSPQALRKSEDSYVDELFAGCVARGAPLMRAHVPRSFIDLNREPFELDPRMFEGELPGYANTGSPRVAGGLGTIPRLVAEGEEIYRGKIPLADAMARIEGIYRPYHRTLTALVDEVMAKNGAMLLVDCHSMPASAMSHVHPAPRGPVDVVLGDRFGASCGEDMTALIETLLRGQGLTILRNKPYAGGFITHTHGAPQRGRHALQIEVNRSLYMNDVTFEKTSGFEHLRQVIDKVIAGVFAELDYVLSPHHLAAE